MPQSLSKILLHVVFSTKNRLPWINQSLELPLYRYLKGVCENLGVILYHVGGMPDHIHLLIALPRTLTVSKLINTLKASSSKWVKTCSPHFEKFSWQNGYGTFSVSQSAFENVVKYIKNQKEHHGKGVSFQEEYRYLLNKHQLEYNEKYLWD